MKKTKNFNNSFLLYLWMVPAFLWIGMVVVYPLLGTIFTSFFYWKGRGLSMYFIGFHNYINIFNDLRFINALKNNIIWLILYSCVPVLLGFCLALLLNTNLKGQNFFKSVYYFPGVISFVAAGIIFSLIYNNRNGLINEFLRLIKLDPLASNWLASKVFAIPAIVLASSWQYIGFCMVLFLAGLQQVPLELIEAAEIDGANFFQRLRYIILPTIRPITSVVILITIINSIRIFDLVLVMTQGGPGEMTEVVGLLMYKKTFTNLMWGEGSAYGVVLLLLVATPSILYVRDMLRKEEKF